MTLCRFLLPPFKALLSATSHTKKFHSSSTPSVVCLLSLAQSLSLPSSYARPSSWTRLSELAGSAPLLCVVPHLKDLCCLLFSPCTFCPRPHHVSSVRAGDVPWPGNSHHCVPCSLPTAQKSVYSTAVPRDWGELWYSSRHGLETHCCQHHCTV